MKHHMPHPQSRDLHLDNRPLKPGKPRQPEGHWIAEHPKLVSIVLACLIGYLVLALFATIKVYMTTGIWPLFG